jgi:hypothetical protein
MLRYFEQYDRQTRESVMPPFAGKAIPDCSNLSPTSYLSQVNRSSQGNRIPRGETMSACVRHPTWFPESN